MTGEVFDKILENRISKMRQVLSCKKEEYAKGEDRLSNFKRAAEVQRITPERALLGMLTKHLVSIIDIIEDLPNKIPSEYILNEKLTDYENYGVLLEALIMERIINNKANVGWIVSPKLPKKQHGK